MIQTLLVAALFTASPIHEMSKESLNAYLGELQSSVPDFQARIAEVALRCAGTPYADGPLGEGPDGKYDTDPIIDLRRVDCVTYVEQTIALAISRSLIEATETLQGIRYRDGLVDFATRNHFMISDWVKNNDFCKDITKDLGVPTESVTRTISKKDFFQRVNAIGITNVQQDETITVDYVPVNMTEIAEEKLPNVALLVFIGNVDWLFSLHCGLYVRDSDGEGKLYHASSRVKRVVAMPLPTYVDTQKERYIGFTAYTLAEPKGNLRPENN